MFFNIFFWKTQILWFYVTQNNNNKIIIKTNSFVFCFLFTRLLLYPLTVNISYEMVFITIKTIIMK